MNRAIGIIRRDVWGEGVDIHDVADKHGFHLVHTIYLDTGPLATALILTGAIREHDAEAVVVPSFEHADSVRHAVTDLAALVTPMQIYPRGYRWPVIQW
ncbi:hypothetical protein [Nocardia carnea]|uniref:hypothetical protein n=1 Tax=Nocardia carnea TaxID=37328 RepID=UPI002457E051|nr:hypothetical protein [Nocardia carnea]